MCTHEKHETAKRNDREWQAMEFVGIQEVDNEFSLELRNCPSCCSTLARLVA